ncbi:hypothetical protein P280DRAFT_325408 [Massarina eburnea CBS 473.64]|uniref:Uncharacterized protein n=1 Tax=Massarina eburnea CBS 473.64 TaxID=1395130 RepID=A0A6A6RYR9_9PLEO|nr:hypothetical protein P280DRAFT_325408 [Massarina eburnea CBS 473.64]
MGSLTRNRSVLRSHGDLPPRWQTFREEHVPLQRRLRRPWFMVHRGCAPALRLQVAIPLQVLPEPRQPRDGRHEQDVRVRGRVQGEVQRARVQALLRVVLCLASSHPHRPEILRSPRRSLLRRQHQLGRRTETKPLQAETAGPIRSHDGDALDRPADAARPRSKQAWRRSSIRPRRHQTVLRKEQARGHHPLARSPHGRLRSRARRKVRDSLLRSSLLRQHRQQGRLHQDRDGVQDEVYAIRGGTSSGYQAHGLRIERSAGHAVDSVEVGWDGKRWLGL